MLTHVLELWASYYSDHAVLRTAIDFLHVGGLLVGGGCAVAADRMTLRATRRPSSDRRVALDTVRDIHRIVLVGLVAVMASGLLLFAADVDTFLHSTVFWLKMGLVALLLLNGSLLVRAERLIQGEDDARGWGRLRLTSGVSLALWLLITLAGAALPNVG
jgi:hypothetical protein